MRTLHADLHIHTCLSPCADNEMSPSTVVRLAQERGLDLIAICDHNSAENVEAAARAAMGTGLAVIGGMEITSREEVHVLGLFQNDRALRSAQEVVYDHLQGENDPEAFGEQLVMNERGEVVRHNPRLLLGATAFTLEEVVRTIHDLGGLAIASHVDRPSFSIISQLGFIPDGLGLDAVEVCSEHVPAAAGEPTCPPWRAIPEGLAVVRSSDAHRLEEIGAERTRFLVAEPTASEIGLALKQVQGRMVMAE